MVACGIEVIDKTDFLSIYPSVYQQSMSSSNIISGFKATGLIPLDSSKVISKLRIKTSSKTPTPPSSSGSNKSFILGKTPGNLRQLHQLKQQLQELQDIV